MEIPENGNSDHKNDNKIKLIKKYIRPQENPLNPSFKLG